MDGKKEILELIEAYIEKTLSPEDRAKFEQRLTEDKELADTWKLNQEVDHVLRPKAVKMENLLNEIGEEFADEYRQKEEPKKQGSKIGPIVIFLFIGLLASLLALFWWNSKETVTLNPDQIFAEAYEPYSVSAAVRSTDDPLFTKLEAAQVMYGNGEYDRAITSLDELLENENLTDEDVLEAHFFKGLSHLGKEETAAAKEELNIVMQSQGHPFTQQAQWYLALIELKDNNPNAAKVYLNNILKITTEGKDAKNAKSLLEQLGN